MLVWERVYVCPGKGKCLSGLIFILERVNACLKRVYVCLGKG